MRLRTLPAAIAAALLWPLAVQAQQQPIPPEHYTLDPRGVDLVTGTFNVGTAEVVIGQPGAGGLVYGRTFVGDGWRDNLVGGLSINGAGELIASVGPVSEAFIWDGTGYVSKYNNGSTYEAVGNDLVVTDRYGNRAVFSPYLAIGDENPYGASEGLITSITTPAGEVTTYTYKQGFRGPFPFQKVSRLSAISNNRGYMLKYTYASDDDDDPAWWRVSNVRGINLAVDWCAATATTCSSFTQTWPSVTYGSFTSFGLPQTATDHAGRTTTYTYSYPNTLAGVASIRYPGATADDVAVTYASDHRVNRVTDASGQWDYAYSTSGSVQTTTATGPLNQELVVEVDTTIGRATSVTDALSNEWAYQYDSDLRVTRVTQPEGDYVEYEYDTRSNVVETTWNPKPGSTLDPIVTSTQYPALPCADIETCNKPESTTDAMGGVTDYEWDSTTGQLLSVTLPAPAVSAARPQTRYAYDAFQARYHDSASTYVNGSAISLPVGTSACVTGDPQGSGPICTTAANEVVSAIDYPTTANPNNLLPVSTSRGSGATPVMAGVAMTYTPQGDVLTVDGPLSGTADTTTYVYSGSDPRQRIGVIGPDPDGGGAGLNRAQRLTYNGRGQVTVAETGTASGGVWANFSAIVKAETDYDAAAFFRPVVTRQMSAAGAISGVQQVTYDAAGRPSCVALRMNPAEFSGLPSSACTLDTTGAFGPDRITQTTYDDLGRPLSTTTGLGVTGDDQTSSVTYTANGRVGSLTDGRGNVSIMEYDGFDRLAKLRYPNESGIGTSTTDYEQYVFDDFGRPESSRNREGNQTYFTFDALGRLIAVNFPSGMPDVSTAYDNLGRMTSTGDGTITVSNTWDPLSRLTAQSSTGVGGMAYQYDAAGRVTRITWPDALYVAYDHDLYGAITAVRENGATSGAGVLATYGWTNLGQPASAARADGSGASTAWSYDAFGRLSSLAHDAASTGNDLTLGFTHNPSGQIVGRTVSNDAYIYTPTLAGTNYTNNGLNQVTAIGGSSVTYDFNANTTGISGATYGYDARNRLTSTSAGLGSTAFTFDPAGRLATSAVGGATIRYQYSGVQLVAEYDGSGTMLARYVPGLGLDDLVTSYAGSGTGSRAWLMADERRSVVALAGATGGVSNINRYDEYGIPASGNNGRFQYTGQIWLPEAAAYHYRARTYLPGVGRFGQSDPIGYAAGQNLYTYVGGDPINLLDPLGLQETDPPIDRLGETIIFGSRLKCRAGAACLTYQQYSQFIVLDPPGTTWWDLGEYAHIYEVDSLICRFRAPTDVVQDYHRRFAYPGQDFRNPVSDGDRRMVYMPDTRIPGGVVTIDLSPDGLTNVNTTVPWQHTLQGTIRQEAYISGDTWRLNTLGVGRNELGHQQLINTLAGPGIFERVHEQYKGALQRRYPGC